MSVFLKVLPSGYSFLNFFTKNIISHLINFKMLVILRKWREKLLQVNRIETCLFNFIADCISALISLSGSNVSFQCIIIPLVITICFNLISPLKKKEKKIFFRMFYYSNLSLTYIIIILIKISYYSLVITNSGINVLIN